MISEDRAAPGKRPLRQISPEDNLKYQNALKAFEKQYQIDQAQFNYNEKAIYYIVSTKFLQSWRDFCMSHQPKRLIPFPINEDLFSPVTRQLREGLKEKEDFEFVTQETYEIFREFWGTTILKRTAVKLGNEKRIPIYLNKYRYICITNLQLRQIDKKIKKRQDFQLKTIEESENATVHDLLAKIAAVEENQITYDHRLWRVDKKENLDTLFKYLKAAADRAYNDYRIKGFGKKLLEDARIEDLQMSQGDFFVVELKEKNSRWFLQSDSQKKCEGCFDVTELKFPCRCEKVAYCTEKCKEKDKHFHLRYCEYAEMEELSKPIDMSVQKGSLHGLVGLRNLGNTCFMNSCLQCLSNTRPLTQYFLKNCFQYEINFTNLLGTKGKLAKSYAKFIRGMWCQSDNVFVPDSVKSAVSSINPMFSGYAQHDSQQFFSFLIDGLHEDLNRVDKKPYVESVESNNRPDKEVALESWLAHIKRNQSIITDVMTGQYKSKVTCPTCSKESITFDPFITVTLPIPQKVVNVFDGFVFFRNFETKTKRVSFPYSKANVQDWTKNIARIAEVDQKSILIYLVSLKEDIYKAGRQSLSEIIYKMQNESKNIFAVQLTQEEMQMTNRVEITARFSKKSYYYNDYDGMWYKFPFFFEKDATTGLTIIKRILRFLYNQAYNDSKNRSKLFGGKSYEQYESIMLNKRPFEIFLRYGKRLDRHYHIVEIKYDEEIQITDNMTLSELMTKTTERDCQLDIRFAKGAIDNFSFERLKDFEDLGRKMKPTSYQKEDSPVDLDSCFSTMSQAEQLEAGNEWYCPNCKQHKQANKQMTIYKAPKVLILHLKRFKQKGMIRKEKNESKVIFPTELNMKPYLIDPRPISSYIEEAKNRDIYIPPKYPEGSTKVKTSSQPIYDLYAVSNHYGGLGGGHYTAFAKNGDRWYDFNDSSVHGVSESSIVGSGAYILFYMRRD